MSDFVKENANKIVRDEQDCRHAYERRFNSDGERLLKDAAKKLHEDTLHVWKSDSSPHHKLTTEVWEAVMTYDRTHKLLPHVVLLNESDVKKGGVGFLPQSDVDYDLRAVKLISEISRYFRNTDGHTLQQHIEADAEAIQNGNSIALTKDLQVCGTQFGFIGVDVFFSLFNNYSSMHSLGLEIQPVKMPGVSSETTQLGIYKNKNHKLFKKLPTIKVVRNHLDDLLISP